MHKRTFISVDVNNANDIDILHLQISWDPSIFPGIFY